MDKKQAIREFKERKVLRGIYAVHCNTTGKVWVGASPNLDATRNELWFQLRMGNHREKDLQLEWNAQGEQAFAYEILETLDDEIHALAVNDRLKEQKKIWAEKLSAGTLL